MYDQLLFVLCCYDTQFLHIIPETPENAELVGICKRMNGFILKYNDAQYDKLDIYAILQYSVSLGEPFEGVIGSGDSLARLSTYLIDDERYYTHSISSVSIVVTTTKTQP